MVLAGSLNGSGPGSAIDELINGDTGTQLSSVNNADKEIGQIFVAQALGYLLAGHKPQAYGVGAAVPTPAPTPSPDAVGHVHRGGRARAPEPRVSRGASRTGGALRRPAGWLRSRRGLPAPRWAPVRPAARQAWARTNHRGEPVTLLEGPAAVAAAVAVALVAPGCPPAAGPHSRWPEPGRPRSAATTT